MSDDSIGQGANSVDGAGAAGTGEQAGSREDQEKKYTDADVDRIVAKKIAAERSKAAKQQNEELEQRERNVARRELSLKASERLSESGFPKELSELMNFSNEEAFEESYKKVTKVFRDTSKPILSGRNPANPDVDSFGFDPVREAFKPPIR